MDPITGPDTFWLNVTNIALGAVTLICCVVVAAGVVKEIVERMRVRAVNKVPVDDHTLVLADLGVMMADGGTRIDENVLHASIKEGEEPNIFKSEN